MNNKIFIQIASYRDPELVPTIEDCIAKAKNPKNFVFGICWQYDETEKDLIKKYSRKKNFRINKHHYSESQGLGWARSSSNKLYDGEKYTLQIDSHHRFVDGWDELLMKNYNQSLDMSNKPVISTYCTPFDPKDPPDKWNPAPCLMSQYEFSADKLLMSMPYFIGDYKTRTNPIRARTISGHFYFANGEFVDEVPYDPDIYFGGYTEETTMSLRAFTHGYDFFSPPEMIMWHEYTRNYRVKHWDDHGKESETKKTSGERDAFARNKTRQLFGTEDHGIDMGIHGLGKSRTLHDYEVFGGFDFKRCKIQEYTLKVQEPPNPEDWEKAFSNNEYKIICEWDTGFFKKFNFQKPKFLSLGIWSKDNTELYRRDFTDRDPNYLNLDYNTFVAKIAGNIQPSKLLMYLYDEEQGWSKPYEQQLI